MSHARGAIARLRAEKEARPRSVEEGLKLRNEAGRELDGHTRHGVADVSTQNLQLAAILEKVTRACVLLEHATFFDRAVAHEVKARTQGELGQIGEALETYREAQRLFAPAAPQAIRNACPGSLHGI